MSILFPKVNKMPDWNYRPIYYDPEKEARKEKLAHLQARRKVKEKDEISSQADNHDEYVPTLRHGSFRQAHEQNMPSHKRASRTSRLAFWIALLIMLIFCFYYLL